MKNNITYLELSFVHIWKNYKNVTMYLCIYNLHIDKFMKNKFQNLPLGF